MKNKKAQFFSITFVIVFIGMLVFAYVGFNKKYGSFEYEIGDKQLALLESYYETEATLFYVDQATEYSLYQSLHDLGKNGGFFKKPECGEYDDFVLWMNKGETCFPDSTIIRNNLNDFLEKYVNEYSNADYKKLSDGDIEKKSNGEDEETGGGMLETTLKNNYDFIFNEIKDVYEEKDGSWQPVVEEELAKKLIEKLSTSKTGDEIGYGDVDNQKTLVIRDIENNEVWTTEDNRKFKIIKNLEVSGITATPLRVFGYDSSREYEMYAVRPNTFTVIGYHLSVYDGIIEKVKKIGEECSEEEQQGKNIKECIAEKLKDAEDGERRWNLNFCQMFSKEEGDCLKDGKIPMIEDGVVSCTDCPKSCEDYKIKEYCGLDPCGLGCEWEISSCVEELSEEEKECLDRNKNKKPEDKKEVPYFSRGFFGDIVYTIFGIKLGEADLSKCAACPVTDPEKCKNYINEKYCNLDPCNLGCYSKLDGNFEYDECSACPPDIDCTLYKNKEYCKMDPCDVGCVWEEDECTEGIKEDLIDKERTFKICVTQPNKRFFVYDEETKKTENLPVAIKFAINLPNTVPPPPIEYLEATDNKVAEDSIIIRWDKSPAADIDHYNIYYKETSNPEEIQKDIKNNELRPIKVYRKDISEEFASMDIDTKDEIKEEKVAKYRFFKDDEGTYEYNVLERNIPYYLKKANNKNFEKQYLFVLDPVKKGEEEPTYYAVSYAPISDGKVYAIAVTPVDIYGNENKEIEKVVTITPKDDLAPNTAETTSLVYSSRKEGNTIIKEIELKWEEVETNTDGSDLKENHLKEYRIYREFISCEELKPTHTEDLRILSKPEETASPQTAEKIIDVSNLPENSCHYFTVTSVDKADREYKNDLEWRGIKIPYTIS